MDRQKREQNPNTTHLIVMNHKGREQQNKKGTEKKYNNNHKTMNKLQ